MQEMPHGDPPDTNEPDNPEEQNSGNERLMPGVVRQRIRELARSIDVEPSLLFGRDDKSTLHDPWPRAVCIALLETMQGIPPVSVFRERFLTLSHYGVRLGLESVRHGVRKSEGSQARAADLAIASGWPASSVRVRQGLLDLARRVVAEESARQTALSSVSDVVTVPVEILQQLMAISEKLSIPLRRITGPSTEGRGRQAIVHGWPRALLVAHLETIAHLDPTIGVIENIIAAMRQQGVYLDASAIAHYAQSRGGIVNTVAELGNSLSWPTETRDARDDLLKIARSIAQKTVV